jgi:Flp pilus assembly protein TadD
VVHDLLNAGLQLHQAGHLEQANSYYEQVLRISPRHPDALHLSGLIAFQAGQLERAAALIEQAIREHPRNAPFHANLAQVYMGSQRPADAHAAFRRAAKLDPLNPQFSTGAASCLAMQGRLKEAERQLREIVRRHARFPLAWFNLGNAVRDQGRGEDAVPYFQRAIELDPRFPDAWNNLGNVLHQLERFADAERCFREHLALQPGSITGYCNLASVLIDGGRFGEGEAVCRQGLAHAAGSPELPKLLRVLSTALAHQGKLHAMLEAARSAAAAAPSDARAQWAYGYALVQAGGEEAGYAQLERALTLQPDSGDLRAGMAGLFLARGDMATGWHSYQSRRAADRVGRQFPHLPIGQRMPGDLSGKTVCLLPEQGLGDNLFFLRYAEAVKARGARIICLADRKLAPLLTRVAALDEIVADDSAPAAADWVTLVGTLPYELARFESSAYVMKSGLHPAHAPKATGFVRHLRVFHPELPPPVVLSALPERLEAMRQRLARIGPGPYAGITWSAGTPPAEQKGSAWVLHKEIPLAALGASLRDSRCTLLSLQRRPQPGAAEELAHHAGRPVHDLSALNDDLESMLAALDLIDEYIGVSNTNMHLRAGIGAAARVLVPQPPEWRWMAAGDESPWFRGFRIYRQDRDGSWGTALARMADDLNTKWPAGR